MFSGTNTIVIDLEVLHSPDDLPTGWNDKRALGLSIGGFYDYMTGGITWFDQENLWDTVQMLCDRQPLIISFNGYAFDRQVMWECLGHGVSDRTIGDEMFQARYSDWERMWAVSYDILAEVWRVTGRNYAKGNSLDALCDANGIRGKTGHGAHAPVLWEEGRIAEVLNYCANDIDITRLLAEKVAENHGHVCRVVGDVTIRYLRRLDDGLVICGGS